MNTTFDKTRFVKLLKWEMMTERKDYMRFAIGIALTLTFLFCATIIALYFDDVNGYPEDVMLEFKKGIAMKLSVFAWTVYLFTIFLGASFVFKNVATKQQRIAFFSLPASNLEKFLVRLLHVMIGYPLCFLVALAFADIMQLFLSFILLKGPDYSVVVKMITMLYSPIYNEISGEVIKGCLLFPHGFTLVGVMESLSYLTFFAFNYAFWIFCGTLFRRNAWLLTLASQVVIGFVVIMIFRVLSFPSIGNLLNESSVLALAYLCIAIAWVVIALMYWGSYRLFSRMQVINNKWLNV